MKTKRFVSTLLALLLVCSLPVSAFAMDNNPAGTTVTEIPAGDTMYYNSGTVTNNDGTVNYNHGTVTTNSSTGTVGSNQPGGTVTTNDGTVNYNVGNGTVTTNNGTVDTNFGTVTTNNGTVTKNSGTVANNGTEDNNLNAKVNINNGTVANNYGTVTDNYKTVTTNNGTVTTNGGTVTTNNGTVEDNSRTVEANNNYISGNNGIVETNNGTVDHNPGTVETNNGTVNNNNGGVTINNTTGIVKEGRPRTNYGTVKLGDTTWYGVQVDNDGTEIGKQYCKPDEVLDFSQLTKEGYVYAGYTQEYQMGENGVEKLGSPITVNSTSYTVTCPNVLTLIWQAIFSPAADDGTGSFGPGSFVSINGHKFLLVAVVEDVYCLASVDSFGEEQLSDLPALLASLLTEDQLTHVTGEPELLDEELTARFFAGEGSHIVFPCDKGLIFS